MTKCKKEKTAAENQQVKEENVGAEAAQDATAQTAEGDKVAEGPVVELSLIHI